jgi:hypothetical protein
MSITGERTGAKVSNDWKFLTKHWFYLDKVTNYKTIFFISLEITFDLVWARRRCSSFIGEKWLFLYKVYKWKLVARGKLKRSEIEVVEIFDTEMWIRVPDHREVQDIQC